MTLLLGPWAFLSHLHSCSRLFYWHYCFVSSYPQSICVHSQREAFWFNLNIQIFRVRRYPDAWLCGSSKPSEANHLRYINFRLSHKHLEAFPPDGPTLTDPCPGPESYHFISTIVLCYCGCHTAMTTGTARLCTYMVGCDLASCQEQRTVSHWLVCLRETGAISPSLLHPLATI